jgi:hypothetical protein
MPGVPRVRRRRRPVLETAPFMTQRKLGDRRRHRVDVDLTAPSISAAMAPTPAGSGCGTSPRARQPFRTAAPMAARARQLLRPHTFRRGADQTGDGRRADVPAISSTARVECRCRPDRPGSVAFGRSAASRTAARITSGPCRPAQPAAPQGTAVRARGVLGERVLEPRRERTRSSHWLSTTPATRAQTERTYYSPDVDAQRVQQPDVDDRARTWSRAAPTRT